jgi:hypothetical protein
MTEIHLPLFAWLLLALAGAVVVYVVIRLIVPLYSGLPGPYVLIAGGRTAGLSYGLSTDTLVRTADLYHPATRDFGPTRHPMSQARAGQTATLLNDGTVLIAGGAGRSAELYLPQSRSFQPTPLMTIARQWHTATLLPDGRVFLAGGSGDRSAEIFDPTVLPSSAFIPVPQPMNVARTGHGAVLLKSGNILLAGGHDDEQRTVVDSAELFDPMRGTFTAVRRGTADATDPHVMKNPRVFFTTTLLNNGMVVITGGLDEWGLNENRPSGNRYWTGEIYDPAPGADGSFPNGSFADIGNGVDRPGGQMADGRVLHTATLLDDGNVLIAGGTTVLEGQYVIAVKTADLWVPPERDPWNSATGSFLAIPGGLTHARGGHTATRLPDGTVLLAGGLDGVDLSAGPQTGTPVIDAEIYDPAGGSPDLPVLPGAFGAIAGIMAEGRLGAAATLLKPTL